MEFEIEREPHTATASCYGEVLSVMIAQSRDAKDLLYKLLLRLVVYPGPVHILRNCVSRSVENSYRPVAQGYLLIGVGDLLQE